MAWENIGRTEAMSTVAWESRVLTKLVVQRGITDDTGELLPCPTQSMRKRIAAKMHA